MIRQIPIYTIFLTLSLSSTTAWSFPASIDSDGDNIPDAMELAMTGDLSPDGTVDSDSDGIPDVVEDNVTNTDKNNDDRNICPGTAPATDLSGLWDVRISDDLSQATDVIEDTQIGVSICHTVENGLQIFHPDLGDVMNVSFDGSSLSFKLAEDPQEDEFVISSGSFTDGAGAFSKGRVEDTSGTFEEEAREIRMDRRTTKAEWAANFIPANLEAVLGLQDIALETGGVDGGPIDIPINPASSSVEVRLDDANPTQAVVYVPEGAIGGYIIPSKAAFIVTALIPDETGLNLDGDSLFDDQYIEELELYATITEPPINGEDGMVRGILDSVEYADIDSDFTRDSLNDEFDSDIYGKGKGPIAEHRTVHQETSSGSRVRSRLVLFNPFLSAETVTISGGNISGTSNTFVDNTDGSSDNDTDELLEIQNRLSPHRDGEKVGFSGNGNDIKTNFLFFRSDNNVTSRQQFDTATYTFSFTGPELSSPENDLTVDLDDYTSTPLDIMQNLRVNGVSLQDVIESGRLINAERDNVISWDEVTSGGIGSDGADKYQVRIENNDPEDEANDEIGDADRLVAFASSSSCDSGSCSATIKGDSLEAGEIFTVRGIAQDNDDSSNRSITRKRFIILGDSDLCTQNSNEFGEITNGVSCGEYYELENNVRTFDNTGGGGTNNDGVLQRYAVFRPNGTPKGMIVLVNGGRGGGALRGDTGTHELFTSSANLLFRSGQLFADAGYLTVATGRPSDQNPSGSSAYDHHRVSANHAHDLAAIINEVKENESLPTIDVFLAGISRGGISVTRQWALGGGIAVSVPVNVNADSNPGTSGIQQPGQVPVGDCTTGDGDGMSCHTLVGVPVHYMWHEDDACRNTAPALAEGVAKDDLFNQYPAPNPGIYGSLTNQFDEFLTGQGITPMGDDCKSLSDHGFIGLESEAVSKITNYLDTVLASLGSNSAPEVETITIRHAIPGTTHTIDLSALAEDLDGDNLSFELPFDGEAIGGETTRGGSINLGGRAVLYNASAGSGITDSFVYVIKDGNGGRSAGIVTVLLSADTDSDGIADGYETAVGGLVVGVNDAADDLDGDGFSNLAEFNAGTNANEINDNPGILAFTASSFDVDEDAGSVTATVSRSGGTAGRVSVLCSIAEDSAMIPEDFNPGDSFQRLVWVDGEGGNKSCTATIVDDEDIESTETIALGLETATGDAIIGTPNSATLNIIDNDVTAASVPHDITGDGKSDVLIRHSSTNAWFLYGLNGLTVESRGGIPMTGNGLWETSGIGDFTGDGTSDVMIRNSNTGAWYLNELDGRTISSRGSVGMTSNQNWEFVGAGDVTGDGRSDVLVRHNSTNAWYLYELNGRTVVSRGGIGMTGNGAWVPQAVADFTGDGTADVLIRNTNTGAWYLNELDGRTISSRGSVGMTSNQNWEFVGAGDVTGDGRADVLVRHNSTNAWFLYELNGRTVVSRGGIGMTGNGAWQPQQVEDFTGDGTADVLIRNTTTGGWYLNELDGRTISGRGSVGMTNNQNWQPQ